MGISMKDDACYRCGSTDFNVVLHFDDKVSIVKCRACHLARTHPYPQFNFESQEKYSSFYVGNESLFRRFARSMMDAMRPYKSSGAFLDIGCAVGYLLDEARVSGFTETTGIELNKAAAEVAAGKGHYIYTDPLEGLSIGSERFDLISFNHVIEHILEFKPFLKKVKELLKPNGIVYCGAPNYDSFMRRLLGKDWYGWGMPDHVWHFDVGTLKSVMAENGFAAKEVMQNSLNYTYSRSLRKNTRVTLARIADRFGAGDQVYGIFVKA